MSSNKTKRYTPEDKIAESRTFSKLYLEDALFNAGVLD